MKKIVWNLKTSSIAAVIFYAVCGVLLLLLPDHAIAIANYAISAVLALAGVLCIIEYFRDKELIGTIGVRLALGLVLLCFAVLMFCYPTFLAEFLPKIWGLSMLVGGFAKVQMSADLKRVGDQSWWWMLIGAALSFLLGTACIANPAFIMQSIIQFIGISLLVEAALDIVSMLVMKKRMKVFKKNVRQAAQAAQAGNEAN